MDGRFQQREHRLLGVPWGSILNGWAVCCTAMPAVDTAEPSMSPEVCGFWLNWVTALERDSRAFT